MKKFAWLLFWWFAVVSYGDLRVIGPFASDAQCLIASKNFGSYAIRVPCWTDGRDK